MPKEHRIILKHADAPGYRSDIECYERHGGYNTLRTALKRKAKKDAEGNPLTPQAQVREEVKASGLRGRGGAGFPCGVKWSFIRPPNPTPRGFL